MNVEDTYYGMKEGCWKMDEKLYIKNQNIR